MSTGPMHSHVARHQPPAVHRRGAALVELAVCLPVLILVVFGTLETCSVIFLKQSLQIASYEAVRVAVREGATSAEAIAAATAILEQRQMEGYNISTTPAEVLNADEGSAVIVRITAPCAPNLTAATSFFASTQLEASTTMAKE